MKIFLHKRGNSYWNTPIQYLRGFFAISLAHSLAACANMPPPKYENGEYVPPPAKHPLKIVLSEDSCDPAKPRSLFGPLVAVVGGALVNVGYDRFINWLDAKQANQSASSTGTSTTNLMIGKSLKRCLILSRANTLEAKFSINPTQSGGYWHMTPYSVHFPRSEAKESTDGEKSLVAEINFATPNSDGTLKTYFTATFDLGRHEAGPTVIDAANFVGQDSGPYGAPSVPVTDPLVTTKITASLVEHGEGRDWIRGVTNALREQENRDKILKPILDAVGKHAN